MSTPARRIPPEGRPLRIPGAIPMENVEEDWGKLYDFARRFVNQPQAAGIIARTKQAHPFLRGNAENVNSYGDHYERPEGTMNGVREMQTLENIIAAAAHQAIAGRQADPEFEQLYPGTEQLVEFLSKNPRMFNDLMMQSDSDAWDDPYFRASNIPRGSPHAATAKMERDVAREMRRERSPRRKP